jgi:hypothetical protein
MQSIDLTDEQDPRTTIRLKFAAAHRLAAQELEQSAAQHRLDAAECSAFGRERDAIEHELLAAEDLDAAEEHLRRAAALA